MNRGQGLRGRAPMLCTKLPWFPPLPSLICSHIWAGTPVQGEAGAKLIMAPPTNSLQSVFAEQIQVPHDGQHTTAIQPSKSPRGAGGGAVVSRGKSAVAWMPHIYTHTNTLNPLNHPRPRIGKREMGVAPRTVTDQGPKNQDRQGSRLNGEDKLAPTIWEMASWL